MKLSKIITPAAVIAVLALAPIPAFAQHGGGHGGGGGHSGGGAAMGGGSRGVGTATPRGGYYGGGYGRYGGYGYGGYGYGGFGWYGGYGYAWGPPYYDLGLGPYGGYPINYPYSAFPSPYGYGYPYAYGYGYYSGTYPPGTPLPGATRQAQGPAQGQYGLNFQITPSTAQVRVDGVYVGTVGQFAPTTQPLAVTPGQHHVEIRADGGYQAITFDVNVAPGQVVRVLPASLRRDAAAGGNTGQ
jgi:hypothetical protein